jgi:hypothetical protein
MHRQARSITILLLTCSALSLSGSAQEVPAPCPEMRGEQVVQHLVLRNTQRAAALGAYRSTRHYTVDYRGFAGARSAAMVVDMEYQPPGTKVFVVRSQSGSKLLIDRVFKKLLESETEALQADNQKRTALNPENYGFVLLGCESGTQGPMYVLAVEPRTKSKFLYRGTIWVDAADFAVVRISAEPAKNPSFWIRKTRIEQVYSKIAAFWLPASNHSQSAVRLGGRAEFSIQYQDYRMIPPAAVAAERPPDGKAPPGAAASAAALKAPEKPLSTARSD